MHIFSELEGSKGEIYITKILKYLLEHSIIFRYEFINFLNKSIDGADLHIEKWFKCKTEVYTLTEEENEKGYIDLMITIDNAIIGIENKIGAEFTVNQPEKYWYTIKKYANNHENPNGKEVKPYLLVFCPKRRIDKIKKDTGKNKFNIQVLSWESLLEHVTNKKRKNNPIFSIIGEKDESIFGSDIVSEYLFENFKLFLYDYLNFLPNFSEMYKNIGSDLQEAGRDNRSYFLSRLLNRLQIKDVHVGHGKTWSGFYLNYYYKDNKKYYSAWFGFLAKSRVGDEAINESDLIVASNFPIEEDNELLTPLYKLNENVWLNGVDADNHWRIEYKENWVSIDHWKNVLDRFIIRDDNDGYINNK